VRIIVNRWSKQIDLDLQQVERFLNERVTGFVPSDYQTAVTSINLGQPLVLSDHSSKIAVEIQRIAATIIGDAAQTVEHQPQRRGLWNSLFRREHARAQQSSTHAQASSYTVGEAMNPSATR
jgi:septum formation inhibitor-activating ATPase MinD